MDFGTLGGGLLALLPGHFIAASMDMQALPSAFAGIAACYHELNLPVDVLISKKDRVLDRHMLPVTNPETTARFILEAAERAVQGNAVAVASGNYA